MNRLMKVAVAAVMASGVGVVALSGSVGASPVKTYALGHAKKCRVDYVKKTLTKTEIEYTKDHGKWKAAKVKIRYIGCVYVAPVSATVPAPVAPTTPVTAPAPVTTSLVARLDPSFVQDPLNPLNVTYSYDADAIATQGNVQTDLDVIAQLPSGVLNLYSNGMLACSMNVGGATNGGTCSTTYSAPGTYQVVTTYESGSVSSTQTDSETITDNPETTTSLTVANPPDQLPLQESTLTAVVDTDYGVLPSATVVFTVGNATFTPQGNNLTCTIDWLGPMVTVPAYSAYVPGTGWVTYGEGNPEPVGATVDDNNNPFYYDPATSPDCTEVGNADIPNEVSVNTDGSTQYIATSTPNDSAYQPSSDKFIL